MLALIGGTLLFVVGLVYLMVLDVRRLRMRAQILAIADPGSDIYRRNLPQKSTIWNFDNELVDKWSEQTTGVWWLVRAAYCVLGGVVMAGVFAWNRRSGQVPIFPVIFPILWCVWLTRSQLLQKKADLAAVYLQSGNNS